jgi:hypothetical protein
MVAGVRNEDNGRVHMKTSCYALVDRLERAGDGQIVLQLNGDHLVGESFEESTGHAC